ncbi:MAG: beta-lactamase family protein [Chloroflexi bacterium]|nr:beta-lactamase family protein [Chloroflexota bacterium]
MKHTAKTESLNAFIRDAMKRFSVPGVAVGVLFDGEEYAAGFGVTNVRHPLPVDADTLFQIGSTTKTFTATTAMRLVEAGKLELDAPVRRYLPDFKMQDEQVAANVQVRDLFTHTAGWAGDYFDDTGSGDDALAEYVRRMADLPQLTPLGAAWSYNNAAFSLAGRVIEAAAGTTYERALTDLVLKPLGLSMSFIMPTDVMTHRFVAGHIVENDKANVAAPWPLARSAHAAGALASTARDQLAYARFHMGDGAAASGERVLKAESLKLMQTPITMAALGEQMALSWFVQDHGDVRVVRHGGATKGQLSAFLFAPTHGFALTVLTNADRGAELHREATAFALKEFLGVMPPKPKVVRMDTAALSAYTGKYTSLLSDNELYLEDNRLMMSVTPRGGFPTKDTPPGPTPPPTRLVFIGPDRVRALDAPHTDLQGEFLRNPDGSVAWFRFGGRIRARA